eukprot:303846-Rhodomonas_salina.2
MPEHVRPDPAGRHRPARSHVQKLQGRNRCASILSSARAVYGTPVPFMEVTACAICGGGADVVFGLLAQSRAWTCISAAVSGRRLRLARCTSPRSLSKRAWRSATRCPATPWLCDER